MAVGGSVMAIATDLGKMTADVFGRLEGAALVALEANYDREMLRNGPYPAPLKRRIASVTGHLCNDDAAAAVARLVEGGCRRVALCHLSEENNRPELVLAAIRAAFAESGLGPGHGCRLQVMRRHKTSDWMEF
jgi:phosphoribosyl 1,2-cyclic phosphodiesterase